MFFSAIISISLEANWFMQAGAQVNVGTHPPRI
jgi:hypothetical protein